jgi:hypothetical protein
MAGRTESTITAKTGARNAGPWAGRIIAALILALLYVGLGYAARNETAQAQTIQTATPEPTWTAQPLPTPQATPVITTPRLLFEVRGVQVYSFVDMASGEVGHLAVGPQGQVSLSVEPIAQTTLFRGGFIPEGQ